MENNTHDRQEPRVAKAEAGKTTVKRDFLRSLETEAHRRWDDARVYEVDAPASPEQFDPHGKYFAMLAFPYMNGKLHLGHAVTLTKAEFAVRFQRLTGANALLPFGFHLTGMPIQAAADKLKRELDEYGIPPRFPEDQVDAAAAPAPSGSDPASASVTFKDPTKFSSKKSKSVAKGGDVLREWSIYLHLNGVGDHERVEDTEKSAKMLKMGIPPEAIPLFRDPQHWVAHFPAEATSDFKSMGMAIDWRRSFVTTPANPYYDSFVRWQFEKLRAKGLLSFAKAYVIWSPMEDQPCLALDRAVGENVKPQEYIGCKIPLDPSSFSSPTIAALPAGKTFVIASSLRPETCLSDTNVWVNPASKYVAWRTVEGEVFITNARAASSISRSSPDLPRSLFLAPSRLTSYDCSFQLWTPQRGKFETVARIAGADLVGGRVGGLVVLPSNEPLVNVATGIRLSCPTDSPFDMMALAEARRTLPEIVANAVPAPVPCVRSPKYGDNSAEAILRTLEIKSFKDIEKAEMEAMADCFQRGGEIILGPFSGQKVRQAREEIRRELYASGRAIPYYEPETAVVSRSGDDGVVCCTQQWYIRYSDPEWKARVLEAFRGLEMFSQEARHQMEHALKELYDWPCSRTYGLGSALPWDPSFLIDSLSDSTIYMAYYAVAHLLHADIRGVKAGPLGLSPQQMSPDVWDMVLLGAPYNLACGVPQEAVQRMRRECDYWLPFDLRVSGKDLVPNHFPMALYHWVALFPPEKWPRAMRANGHLKLNGRIMSKKTGNFLTVEEAVTLYGADAVRLALADAGDTMDDGNCETTVLNAAVLRLYTLVQWCRKMIEAQSSLRAGPLTAEDEEFVRAIHAAISSTGAACKALEWKIALRSAVFDFQSARDVYLQATKAVGPHKDLVRRFMEVQAVMLSIFCPHTAEAIWAGLGHSTLVVNARFPQPSVTVAS